MVSVSVTRVRKTILYSPIWIVPSYSPVLHLRLLIFPLLSTIHSILSIMFSTFDLEMVEKTLPEPNYDSMVVGPKGKCMMRYKRKICRS
jgi:hypothetical protein